MKSPNDFGLLIPSTGFGGSPGTSALKRLEDSGGISVTFYFLSNGFSTTTVSPSPGLVQVETKFNITILAILSSPSVFNPIIFSFSFAPGLSAD